MDTKAAAVMVKPTIGLDVQSWSFDKFIASSASHDIRDGAKVTSIEMHSVRHWILSCDKDGEIFLWDYNTNVLLMRKTVAEMYATVGREEKNFSSSGREERDSTTNSTSGNGNRNMSSQSSLHSRANVVHSRGRGSTGINGTNSLNAARTHSNLSKGLSSSSISLDILKMSLAMRSDKVQQKIQNRKIDRNSLRKSKDYKFNLGDVRQVCFADRTTIAHLCGCHSTADEDTFNSDSRLMIVCDLAIIFYDFILDTAVAITSDKAEISKGPKCATFIFKNICAVGYGDGQIRVWGFQCSPFTGQRSKQVKVLSGHHREIALIKILQVPSR